jgi:hypothetical protein
MKQRAIVGAFVLGLAACGGELRTAGEAEPTPLPAAAVAERATRQELAGRQILFGDLHVHTTFSNDAFLLSLPMMGGSGMHPPADACDFARFCSTLDFWSINDHAEGLTTRHWDETIDAIEQCNAVAGDPSNPDTVAFLGWEWTQVGLTPDQHYGHKNVILRETERAKVPRRAIAADRGDFRTAILPGFARYALPVLHFSQRQQYFDYQRYSEEIGAEPFCPPDIAPGSDERCHEVAGTPRDLYGKLERWGGESIVIPHGTSWGLMTPASFDIARELERDQHDPERQLLFEVYSGHGSAEQDTPHRAILDEEGALRCPEPAADFEPCCWRAGEIIRARCEDPGSETCEERVTTARQNYVDAGAAGHRTVPGASVEDWLDCDQCRTCFNPAFSHRPGGSLQHALALRVPDGTGGTRSFRFGLIGASDTHDARGGNGFKEFARVENTEAPHVPPPFDRAMRDGRDPTPESLPVRLADVPISARRHTERGASFFMTGGLSAVHSEGRSRDEIWQAMQRREVYATSGDRILLWFELVNPVTGGRAPMGAEAHPAGTPRFRVAAAGAFEQQPGCPDAVTGILTPERVAALCLDECHNPGERRRDITRIEVIRIRGQRTPGEVTSPLVEDPWRVLPCPGSGEGCELTFADPEFDELGGEVAYYVRAIQEPTPAINAGGLRCTTDDAGRCVSVDPCYGDERTPADDDCLSPNEERAWSSPIFLRPAPTRDQPSLLGPEGGSAASGNTPGRP